MRNVRTPFGGLDGPVSTRAFTLSGGLLLMSPTHVIAEEFVGVPFPTWLVAVFVLPGLLAALVGLAGLYPIVRTHRPRLARAASVPTVATGVLLLGLLAISLGNALLVALTGTTARVKPGPFVGLLPIGLALAFGLFGSATWFTNQLSRTSSLLLFALTLPWLGVLGATALIGDSFPGWLTLTLFGPLPVWMFGLGASLHRTDRETPSLTPTSDPIAD